MYVCMYVHTPMYLLLVDRIDTRLDPTTGVFGRFHVFLCRIYPHRFSWRQWHPTSFSVFFIAAAWRRNKKLDQDPRLTANVTAGWNAGTFRIKLGGRYNTEGASPAHGVIAVHSRIRLLGHIQTPNMRRFFSTIGDGSCFGR